MSPPLTFSPGSLSGAGSRGSRAGGYGLLRGRADSDSSDTGSVSSMGRGRLSTAPLIADAVARLCRAASMEVPALTRMQEDTFYEYCQFLSSRGAVLGVGDRD